jgi:hypothetical protein
MREDGSGAMRERSGPPRGGIGCLWSGLITLVVAVGVLLAVGLLAARTSGVKRLIEDALSREMEMKMQIGAMRVAWPYDLVVEDLHSKEQAPGGDPVLEVSEARIGLGLRTPWRLYVRGAILNLMQLPDGNWRPASMAPLGDLPQQSLADLSSATRTMRDRWRIEIEDSAIRWFAADGRLTLSVNGIAFEMSPIRLPTRDMQHYRVAVYQARGRDEDRADDVEREWLASETDDYIEVGRGGRETTASARGFWGKSE